MAVAFEMRFKGATLEQYDHVMDHVVRGAQLPRHGLGQSEGERVGAAPVEPVAAMDDASVDSTGASSLGGD